MRRIHVVVVASSLVAAGVSAQPAAATEPCAGLVRLELPGAKVVSAEIVPAGAFTPPQRLSPWLVAESGFYEKLPAFCRVVVKATPSADSDVRIEVWMPPSGWSGRFRGQGNGGFAGEIDHRSMGMALSRGDATAATDTGHTGAGTDAAWAAGHPERVTDFGHRAIHAMTAVAKAVIRAHYGRPARHSYFSYCSNGGRQALMEAQRYPEDYDGIVAGAPAHHWTHLMAKDLAVALAIHGEAASYIPPGKIPAIARAVNATCDARDAVTDGVLDDPRSCRFDPETLLCRDGDSEACLTPPQARALRTVYEPLRDAEGREVYPGFLPGAEEGEGGWEAWVTGSARERGLLFAFGTGFFPNMVYDRPGWDFRQARLEEALTAAVEKTAEKVDATDPDLAAFRARGGKLILYHGWNDAAIPAEGTIRYYDAVRNRLGERETEDFVRLYMVSGMKHCYGGPGPNAFGQLGTPPSDDPRRDVTRAIERWVEVGEVPSVILATKYVDDDPAKGVQATRPLCPYPQVSVYGGQGEWKDAASFRCAPGGP
jgi:feruloyl esterase